MIAIINQNKRKAKEKKKDFLQSELQNPFRQLLQEKEPLLIKHLLCTNMIHQLSLNHCSHFFSDEETNIQRGDINCQIGLQAAKPIFGCSFDTKSCCHSTELISKWHTT